MEADSLTIDAAFKLATGAGRGELMRRLDRIENKLDRALNGTNRGR